MRYRASAALIKVSSDYLPGFFSFRFAGLLARLPLDLPNFISSCGLGGIRTSAAMIFCFLHGSPSA
jgi:hypothetical protein